VIGFLSSFSLSSCCDPQHKALGQSLLVSTSVTFAFLARIQLSPYASLFSHSKFNMADENFEDDIFDDL